tara:strand:- start:1064 stop:1885 length:822 start_codon:yes stop_codon:yes gene_type:complete
MLNIIIGARSNLSIHLANEIDNCLLISSKSIDNELASINWDEVQNANLILNQFQPSFMLNDLSSPINYINNSILSTSRILEFVKNNKAKFNKIIYTSSSSVYGRNKLCNESDTCMPISLYAALKLANEHLVSSFCSVENIEYTVTRVFNMYGGNDRFSIISKLVNAINNNTEITLINNGSAIRDFVYIDDVVKAYKSILACNKLPIVNIASGEGISINSILEFLNKKGFIVKYKNIKKEEVGISIADNTKLKKLCQFHDFNSLEEHLIKSLKK